MTFSTDLQRFAFKLEARVMHVAFPNVVSAVQDSIVNGSGVTGAPGQPVDTGTLRNSWQARFESPTAAVISTNLAYAPIIEAGAFAVGRGNVTGSTTQRLTFRSQVGGPHSVKLTRNAYQRLVDAEAVKVRDA